MSTKLSRMLGEAKKKNSTKKITKPKPVKKQEIVEEEEELDNDILIEENENDDNDEYENDVDVISSDDDDDSESEGDEDDDDSSDSEEDDDDSSDSEEDDDSENEEDDDDSSDSEEDDDSDSENEEDDDEEEEPTPKKNVKKTVPSKTAKKKEEIKTKKKGETKATVRTDGYEEEAAPARKPAKEKKKKVEKEKKERIFDIKKIEKNERFLFTLPEDFSNMSNKQILPFFNLLKDYIEESDIISFNNDDMLAEDKYAAATNIWYEIQRIAIKAMISENASVPFLNGKIYAGMKDARPYPCGHLKGEYEATFQPELIEVKMTPSYYKEGVGLLHKYNGLLEVSAAGHIEDDKFIVETDSVERFDGTSFWKKGDVLSLETGRKLKKKTSPSTGSKKTVKSKSKKK